MGNRVSTATSSSADNYVLREKLIDQLAALKQPTCPDADATITDTTTTTTSSSTTKDKELSVAAQLTLTLIELSITLTASYFISKLIAKTIQGGRPGGDATDEFQADNGTSSVGVIKRLQNMLVRRHEATLKAMMSELEDHKLQWANDEALIEEKKDEELQDVDTDDEEQIMFDKIQTEQQYAQLQTELQLQHQESLTKLSTLSAYEMNIANSNVIDPQNIPVTFSDVGGMDDIKSEIYDLVVLPLLRPDLFMSDSGLVSPPKGILLYGPPGTGKTMLAKAIAKESHATFVNVQLSTIMNKWFGESNKLISATFQIARKLAPSVVFIDEIDAFLSQRDSTEGSAVSSMKSEFLTLWDGLLSERRGSSAAQGLGGEGDTLSAPMLPTPPIIVLGATNRPYDVDAAILRRLPRSFEVPLPSQESRHQLLRLFLQKQNMTQSAKDYLPTLAQKTEGYSGSDLKEVCRAAAWEPVREMTTGASRRAVGCDDTTARVLRKQTSSGFPRRGTKVRPVSEKDLLLAIHKVKKTGEAATNFHVKEHIRGRDKNREMAAAVNGSDRKNGGNVRNNDIDVQKLMAMAMQAAASMNSTTNGESSNGRVDDDEEGDDMPNV